MIKHFLTVLLMILYLSVSCHLNAQNPSPSLGLKELLKQAMANYPLLKSKALEVQAAQKGVNASQRTLVPTLDAAYQANFATYNNIIGMASPTFLIPISGPPSADNNYSGVYGSSASVVLNWQPFTFGQRNAQIDYSKAGLQQTTADEQNEIFQHKVKVICAYLDVLMSNELVKVYEKNYVRTETNLKEIKALVVNGIKPGLDTAMFKAELSRAKIELLDSRKYKQQTQITLSQYLASDNPVSATDSSYFSRLPSVNLPVDSVRHPLMALFDSNIEMTKAKRKMLSRTMLPTFGVWGTTYARGSGIHYDGVVNASDGLSFQRYNYGVGVQLSLPVLQYARINPQLQQQELLIQSDEEKLQEVSLQLRKQLEMADTTLNNALAAAKENPILLQSSDFSYKAMLSRYQSGLANYADLIQSQYILIKAETENKTAYISAWKALLFKAAVKGDLNLFLNQVN
jgi:outer membrane protein